MTLKGTPNVTSLPESADGATPCILRDGRQTDLFGPDHVPASHFQVRETGGERVMTGTSGLSGSTSSASAALQRSLESRLAARLPTGGLTMFIKGWSRKATPLGRLYCQLAVLVRPIKETDCGLWPTAQTRDFRTGESNRWFNPARSRNLNDAAAMALWPTPRSTDGDKATRTPDGAAKEFARNKGPCLATTAMAMWPTPATRDHKDTGNLESSQFRKDGKERKDSLGRVAYGSTAQTENKGSLNPAFPCWLMGYPIEWESCADMVTPSSRKSRRNL